MDLLHHQLKPTNDDHHDQEEDNLFLSAMGLVHGAILPMIMKTAIELGLLEIIAKASSSQLSSSEIASQIPAKNKDALAIIDRILFFLASHSILTCKLVNNEDGHIHRVYGLAPVCRYFIQNEDGVSLAPFLLLFQDKTVMEYWYNLKEAVQEGGIPLEMAQNGKEAYAPRDDNGLDLLNQSMYNHTTIVMKKILQTYNGLEGLNDLVDVGGGLGANLRLVISKYPQIKGINFDLPHVIKDAPSSPGIKHVGGDMFVEIPKAQAIFLKCILHNWSDEHCLKLLKSCYEALPKTGKVIAVECIAPEFPETDLVTQSTTRYDLTMFSIAPGAKERMKKEFQALATEAGFSYMKAVCVAYCYWVIEFYKK